LAAAANTVIATEHPAPIQRYAQAVRSRAGALPQPRVVRSQHAPVTTKRGIGLSAGVTLTRTSSTLVAQPVNIVICSFRVSISLAASPCGASRHELEF
jgi:hypothetical protein